MKSRAFAAITLAPTGGGVATASRLIWKTFEDEWRDDCQLLTLANGDPSDEALRVLAARLSFGSKLGALQVGGQCRWIFYSHLAIAQVQRYVPSLFRKPYGIFLHGIEIWRPLSDAQRRVVSEAAIRVANSSYTARRVAAEHPWIGRIDVCQLALPEAPEAPDASTVATTGQSAEGLRVIVVGRLDSAERYKGHDQLLEAWPSVCQHVPTARLVIVGTGDDAARLQDKARSLGIGGVVEFTGFVSDDHLDALYRRAALLAMPSRNEGFGLVYLEAMRHGLPCIGSVHDAAGDVIEDGVTGFLVDQADTAALADRIVRLLQNATLRTEMGEAGRRRGAREFSYGAFRARFVAELQRAFADDDRAATVPESVPREVVRKR